MFWIHTSDKIRLSPCIACVCIFLVVLCCWAVRDVREDGLAGALVREGLIFEARRESAEDLFVFVSINPRDISKEHFTGRDYRFNIWFLCFATTLGQNSCSLLCELSFLFDERLICVKSSSPPSLRKLFQREGVHGCRLWIKPVTCTNRSPGRCLPWVAEISRRRSCGSILRFELFRGFLQTANREQN